MNKPPNRMIESITPLILTYNEAANIERALSKLEWAREVLVVDSLSTDDTVALAGKAGNARVLQRPFDDHTGQWNFGVAAAQTDWVLTMDADYLLSDELVRELEAWRPEAGTWAYFAEIRYCIAGHPLRGTLYPPRAVLFHRGHCRYVQDGHTQELSIEGKAGRLRGAIFHDDYKPLSSFIWAQDRYARLEVEKLLRTDRTDLSFQDKVRRKVLLAPVLVFFYTLFAKRLILDGWPGWYYALQRTLFEVVLSLYLLDARWPRLGSSFRLSRQLPAAAK